VSKTIQVKTGLIETEMFHVEHYTKTIRRYAVLCLALGLIGSSMLLTRNVVCLFIAYCCFLAMISVAFRWLWIARKVESAYKYRWKRLQTPWISASASDWGIPRDLHTPAYLRRSEAKFEGQTK